MSVKTASGTVHFVPLINPFGYFHNERDNERDTMRDNETAPFITHYHGLSCILRPAGQSGTETKLSHA